LKLLRQNKLSVPGYSETVFLFLMDDDHLPSTLKERCALHPELPVGKSSGICG
jgi:hypothetical protein